MPNPNISNHRIRQLLLLFLLPLLAPLSVAENISDQGILLLDIERELTPTLVLERLANPRGDEITGETGFPKHAGQYWFAMNVESDVQQRWAVRMANAHFREIELFLFHQGELVLHEESGYHASTEGLHTLSSDWLNELPIQAGKNYQMLIRVASPIVSSLNINLEKYESSLITSSARTSYLFFLVGISLSLALHNLFFGATVRDVSHILYAIHSLFGVVFVVSAYGLFNTVFGFYDYELYFYKPSSVGVQLFGTWFCYVFFQVPRLLKELDWAFKALMLYYVVLFITYPFTGRELFSIISAAPHPIFGTLMIASAWLAYRRGFKPAIFVFIGWIALIAGSTLPALVTIGLAPSFENILLAGLTCHVFEMYMLSLAISQKFRSIQLDNIAAKELEKSRSAFITYFSHEVKTPINGMLGLIKLLKQTSLNQQQNSYIEQMNRSGNKLLQQLNSVLLLESGRQQQLKTQSTSLLDILDSSVALVQGICEEKNIQLEYLIEPNVPTVIETDPDLLQQLINNLLNNAAKYTESGEINVLCSGQYLTRGEMNLCFSIKDTGIGIPYEDQDRIFHSFTKASNNRQGELMGTGMGLAIVKNIADRLGGRISFRSEPGKGSRFDFHLRVRIPEQNIQMDEHLTILVVDDVELNTEIIASLLRGAGHTVHTTVDPSEAVILAEEYHFDAVLLDIHMPLISGQELMPKLREIGINCPIIGISAGLTAELSEQLKAQGMELLMEKPFSLPVFYSLVQRHDVQPIGDASVQRYDIRFLDDIARYKNPEELQDFFSRYHDSCLELLAELEAFKASKNAKQLAASSHRLAGLCAALGLIDSAQQAKQLQLMSEKDALDWSTAEVTLKQLKQRLQNGLAWLTLQVNNKGIERQNSESPQANT
ncbi:ATP-binding protein [Pseudoteredinibacter isoporae]|uniref:histidine kinase n=1 Tax=Pseudoteredinibacter isoporae TaxID=570281 RepID=A0A7X0MZ13_9GAMM|nr:ATP-binding protein [Pseudoteredinibacter isoporae]MBB6523669.1 signal transduction histidine kinase/response regulator of citrate/malate metabolism [Pseudoteredinibacter isoporae]NHO89173.1 response regulator [Pseudoteredinibacter isoporae]NIB22216.1 response regulator [Pseudoteredinibacter isoporae]